MNNWMSAIIASTPARPMPRVVTRLPLRANHAVPAVAGGTINVAMVGKRASLRRCSVIKRPTIKVPNIAQENMPAVPLQRDTGDEGTGNDRQRQSRMNRMAITRSRNPMCHKRRREDRPQRNQPKVEGAEVRGVRGCLSHQQHRDHRNVTEGEALLWVTQVGNER